MPLLAYLGKCKGVECNEGLPAISSRVNTTQPLKCYKVTSPYGPPPPPPGPTKSQSSSQSRSSLPIRRSDPLTSHSRSRSASPAPHVSNVSLKRATTSPVFQRPGATVSTNAEAHAPNTVHAEARKGHGHAIVEQSLEAAPEIHKLPESGRDTDAGDAWRIVIDFNIDYDISVVVVIIFVLFCCQCKVNRIHCRWCRTFR